jgi:hypothetical protein
MWPSDAGSQCGKSQGDPPPIYYEWFACNAIRIHMSLHVKIIRRVAGDCVRNHTP